MRLLVLESKMAQPTRNNDKTREELAHDIKVYLAKGGKVTVYPPQTFSTKNSLEKTVFDISFKGVKNK
ncbi:hypothetical protein N9K75_00425 [bacterium]|nr:hypothetical protein [bacterium]